MKLFLKRILTMSVFSIGLMGIFVLVVPIMVKKLSFEAQRHFLVSDLFDNEDIKPEIIITGDSRTMSGVNGKTISRYLPDQPSVYNIATLGQSIQEGAYFFTHIPSGVKIVVQCIEYTALQTIVEPISDIKALRMIISGLNINEDTILLLNETHPFFQRSKLKNIIASRIMVKNSLHYLLKVVVAEEQLHMSKLRDPFFPYIYISNRHPDYPNYAKYSYENYDNVSISDEKKNLVHRINDYFQDIGVKYYLVISPINPDQSKINPEIHIEYMRQLRKELEGIEIIDMHNALDTDDFYDGIHPNLQGAEKFSKLIATAIQ